MRLYYFPIFIIAGHETLSCSHCTNTHTGTYKIKLRFKWKGSEPSELYFPEGLLAQMNYRLLHTLKWQNRQDRRNGRKPDGQKAKPEPHRHNEWKMLPVKTETEQVMRATTKDVYLLSFSGVFLHNRNWCHWLHILCCYYKNVIMFGNMRRQWKHVENRNSGFSLHFVQTGLKVNWPQQSSSANIPWQMWRDGISGPNKLWNVLLPLVSVWTINQPPPLRTMSLLVRDEGCSGRTRRACQQK